jgi:L-amino acid N-acyltransferase YncA
MIRLATPTDGAAIARIYNQNLTEAGFANCDLNPATAEARACQIATSVPRFPTFVHEQDGTIAGWSSIKKLSARPCYPDVGEIAVYVDRDHRAKLVGAALLVHVIDAARERGFQTLISIILSKNLASLRGAQATGFQLVATLREAAHLHGQWIDVLWLARDLTQPPDERSERIIRWVRHTIMDAHRPHPEAPHDQENARS